jgi:hypothetical protein
MKSLTYFNPIVAKLYYTSDAVKYLRDINFNTIDVKYDKMVLSKKKALRFRFKTKTGGFCEKDS